MQAERDFADPGLYDELPVLLNVSAGRALQTNAQALVQTFAAQNVRVRVEASKPNGLAGKLEKLLCAGVTAVGVAGGDGSISLAANVLADTDTVLVPIPIGSRNHFAVRFGLVSIEAVATALHRGSVRSIAVGEVNGRCFVNNVSCGFYPRLVRQREQLRPLLSRWPATVLAAALVSARRPLFDLAIQMEGALVRRRATAVWIGIGRRSLQLPEAGAGEGEGELLEVVLPRPYERLRLLALALRLWRRLRRQEAPADAQLETLCAPEFTLQSAWPIDVAIDGEPQVMTGPLRFVYRKQALRVLCLLPDR
jgi:diacylglycerol kinase family enzyme